MTGKIASFALALLTCAGAQAATISTTVTVNATAAIGASITATGTATFSNTSVGSGTFKATFSLTPDSSGNLNVPFTITITATGDTLTGTLKIPEALLTGSTATGSATITGGTGAYAGATGSFPSLTGSGSVGASGFTLTFTGAGTITTGAGGGGGGGGAVTPTISQVQNNYSYILPGLPNYGIAPGSLFIVKGANLATNQTPVLQSSAAPGLPTTLNGASISVTVSGTTVTPALYYTSAGQLAAVLPSNTPTGTGTITVTTSGTASTPAPITVVQSALGLDTYYGTGTGLATAQDANYNLFSSSNSASPGQTIILWGSGVGADTSNNDKTYPMTQNNLTSIPMQLWIGGVQASIQYRGRSQFPGVDQVVVTIPSNVQTGCNVSIVAVSGSIVSNGVTIPVAQGGGTCSDPSTSSIDPGLIQQLSGKATVNFGVVEISQSSVAGQTSAEAAAIFYRYPGSIFTTGSNANVPSLGSCVILTAVGTAVQPVGLDAGTITVTGPGTQATLQGLPSAPGDYFSMLTSIPANGGAFTFAGSGGKDVGSFNTTINFPPPLVWTNQSSITTVNRAQGQTVTWTGGAPGTFVVIEGQSTLSTTAGIISATFTCYAPVSAGQFGIPSWVLLALPPAKNGSLSLINETNPQSFSASGLDYAYGLAVALDDSSVAYQ